MLAIARVGNTIQTRPITHTCASSLLSATGVLPECISVSLIDSLDFATRRSTHVRLRDTIKTLGKSRKHPLEHIERFPDDPNDLCPDRYQFGCPGEPPLRDLEPGLHAQSDPFCRKQRSTQNTLKRPCSKQWPTTHVTTPSLATPFPNGCLRAVLACNVLSTLLQQSKTQCLAFRTCGKQRSTSGSASPNDARALPRIVPTPAPETPKIYRSWEEQGFKVMLRTRLTWVTISLTGKMAWERFGPKRGPPSSMTLALFEDLVRRTCWQRVFWHVLRNRMTKNISPSDVEDWNRRAGRAQKKYHDYQHRPPSNGHRTDHQNCHHHVRHLHSTWMCCSLERLKSFVLSLMQLDGKSRLAKAARVLDSGTRANVSANALAAIMAQIREHGFASTLWCFDASTRAPIESGGSLLLDIEARTRKGGTLLLVVLNPKAMP